jgi:hypothetical protein
MGFLATIIGLSLTAGTAVATAPSITSFGCEGSGGRYFCFVNWTGATAPVSVRWFKDGAPVSAFDDRSFLLQNCQIGTWATFRVVVTDATGGSGERSGGFACTLL